MDRLSWHNCPDLLYRGASFLYETGIRRCSGRTPEARLCDVAASEKAQRERHLGFHPRLHLSSEKLSKLLFLLSFVACLVAGGRDVHLSVIMRLVGNDKTQLESHLEYRDKKKKILANNMHSVPFHVSEKPRSHRLQTQFDQDSVSVRLSL